MQPVEKVNKIFLAKLILLSVLLYLGFVVKVPQFTKSAEAEPLQQYATPNEEQEPKQIKKLYYRMVSDTQSEEIAI